MSRKKGSKLTEEHKKKIGESCKIFTKEQELQICKEYFLGRKFSIIFLGRKWGCNFSTIRNIIMRNGYNLRLISEANKKITKEKEQQICQEYFSKEKPSIEILSKRCRCSKSIIRNTLRRNGYFLRLSSETQKMFSMKQEQQICKQYIENNLSACALAKEWKCNDNTIRNIIIRNGYRLKTHKEVMKSIETRKKLRKISNNSKAIQRALKNGYGNNCYYKGEFFPSLSEKDCYIRLMDKRYKIIHNFLHRFDFLVILPNKEKVVVEFHPYDFKLTNLQYYWKRRKLLNEYGYKDLKLVVIKDLKEIETKVI